MREIGYTRTDPSTVTHEGLRMTHTDLKTGGETGRRPTVAELFAGVGGFHLALDRAGFDVVWSNQWEPATKAQTRTTAMPATSNRATSSGMAALCEVSISAQKGLG